VDSWIRRVGEASKCAFDAVLSGNEGDHCHCAVSETIGYGIPDEISNRGCAPVPHSKIGGSPGKERGLRNLRLRGVGDFVTYSGAIATT
jgi:hypothetical protein